MCVHVCVWVAVVVRVGGVLGEGAPSSKCLCSCSVVWREEQSTEWEVRRDWLGMRFSTEWEGESQPRKDA